VSPYDGVTVILLIVGWEFFRYALVRSWWAMHANELLDECTRCGAQVPDIAFHRKHCPNRFDRTSTEHYHVYQPGKDPERLP
jgi:hypothetical protein